MLVRLTFVLSVRRSHNDVLPFAVHEIRIQTPDIYVSTRIERGHINARLADR